MDDNTIMMTFAIIFSLFVVFLLIVQPKMYEVIPNKRSLAPTHVIGQTYSTVSHNEWQGDYKPDGPNISRRWEPFPEPIKPTRYLPIKGVGTYFMTHNP